MNMVDIIEKKRDGKELSRKEIYYFIESYTKGNIPDYQVAALLMAIYFSKMTREETFHLTDAIKDSGQVLDLSHIRGIKVDKHSTGGVGDKTTLIVGPMAAACGVPIAKMSGRGLGFTGGTIDKLESIPGFQTELSPEEFKKCVIKNGIAIMGQSADIAKADKLLYALRDVTATMENPSLIASSIMSKKLAAGSDAILLDIKCGSGAFLETFEETKALGEMMVGIGNSGGKKTIGIITDMSQPLGRFVGNALEVMEAIDVLKNKGAEDIRELSLTLAGFMVYMGEKAESPEEGRELVQKVLTEGKALEVMRRLVRGQGGNEAVIDDYSLLPRSQEYLDITSDFSGYVKRVEAHVVGKVSQSIGAGRRTKEDIPDPGAGVVLHKKRGDIVQEGEVIATLYGNNLQKIKKASIILKEAFVIDEKRPSCEALVKGVIGL